MRVTPHYVDGNSVRVESVLMQKGSDWVAGILSGAAIVCMILNVGNVLIPQDFKHACNQDKSKYNQIVCT